MRSAIVVFALAGLLSVQAAAEQPRAGLWELTSTDMQVDGQQLPAMQQMLEQLQKLPPEQRKMMEEMMAKQGVALGGQGVRVCLSEEQVRARRLPVDQQSGCTQEIIDSSDSHWKFRYQCPNGSGEGVARLISDREFTTEVKSSTQTDRGLHNSEVKSHARWIADDCGALRSR